MTVWGETRARGGRVLLRIEDHDRQRSRTVFETAILDDLAWLGLAPDAPLVRQSERGDIYTRALDGLRARGLVYACSCSRSDVEQSNVVQPLAPADRGVKPRTTPGTGLSDSSGAELRYPGTCRDRGLSEGSGIGLRVRLEASVEHFVDLRLGPQEQVPAEQCGDLLVRDRKGNWTYQFAATVDDYVQGITLVVRGVDLLASTGRQLQLARLLGRVEPPAFLHHALIMKSTDAASAGSAGPLQKLSKSDGDTGIRELRARGWTPAEVVEHALSLVLPGPPAFPYHGGS